MKLIFQAKMKLEKYLAFYEIIETDDICTKFFNGQGGNKSSTYCTVIVEFKLTYLSPNMNFPQEDSSRLSGNNCQRKESILLLQDLPRLSVV